MVHSKGSVLSVGADDVTWFKEGKPLRKAASSEKSGDSYTLTIKPCELLDAGEYTLTAKNKKGATFCSVNVTIEGECKKSKRRDILKIQEGSTTQ